MKGEVEDMGEVKVEDGMKVEDWLIVENKGESGRLEWKWKNWDKSGILV